MLSRRARQYICTHKDIWERDTQKKAKPLLLSKDKATVKKFKECCYVVDSPAKGQVGGKRSVIGAKDPKSKIIIYI